MEMSEIIARDKLLEVLFWLRVGESVSVMCERCEGNGAFYTPKCCGDFSRNECCGQPIEAYDPCGLCYGVGDKELSRGLR